MAVVTAWYKVQYSFKVITMPGPRDYRDERIREYVPTLIHNGNSHLPEVNDVSYDANYGWYYSGVANKGYWIDEPSWYGPKTFVNTSTQYVIIERKVVEIVSDPSFNPGSEQGGYTSVTLRNDNSGYQGMYFSMDHIGYQWFRGEVEITDNNNNGYDDAGEHDAPLPALPPPLPPFDPNPPPALDIDVLNAALSLAHQAADAYGDAGRFATAAGALGRALPVLGQAISTADYVAKVYGSSDPRKTAFVEGVSLVVTTALTIGAVATAATAAPVAIVFAGAALVYTAAAKTHVTAVLNNWWDNTYGSSAQSADGRLSDRFLTELSVETGQRIGQITIDHEALIADIVSVLNVYGVVLDQEYYLQQHPEVLEGLRDGSISSILSHFLTVGVASGFRPNANTAALAPSDLAITLPNEDAVAGSRLSVRSLPIGTYAGDGSSPIERALVTRINAAQDPFEGGWASQDAFLDGMANRLAIDLVANNNLAPQLRVANGETLDTVTFSGGPSLGSLVSEFDYSGLRAFVVASNGLDVEGALAAFRSKPGVDTLLFGGSVTVGVAEYAGVWVLLIDTGPMHWDVRPEIAFDLVLYGHFGDDYLVAGQRAGDLRGWAGNDTLIGSASNDRLDGGTGDDQMAGGPGDDYYIVDSIGDIVIENAGEGFDTVETSVSGYVLPANVERLIYTGPSTGSVTLIGNDGDNVLTGSAGADIIIAGAGTDALFGGGGIDGFFLGENLTPGDTIDGGASNDILGLRGNYSNYTFSASNLIGIELLILLPGSFTTYGGNASDRFSYHLTTIDANVAAGQMFVVNAANLLAEESLYFNGSAETDGSFFFFGGAGDDTLIGGAGADIFASGFGRDVLTGGGGADLFYFRFAAESPPEAKDSITDFAAGDHVSLSAFAQTLGHALSFIDGAAFSGSAGQLRVAGSGTGWTVEIDMDGDGDADFAIDVTTNVSGYDWSASDFIL